MIVRLDKHSLLLGLVAALGGGFAVGCSDPAQDTDLDPEGAPEILQVFVRERTGAFTMTYGFHEEVNTCDDVLGLTCATGFTCATTGDQAGHCVDGSGKQPKATNAIVRPAQIRIVSKELLDGSTLEQFLCACGNGCAETERYSASATDCSACGNNAMTPIDESGRCLDLDDDGLADFSTLKPDVATVTCGAALTYNTRITDGFYYPSGNQIAPAAVGVAGLGPAIVLVLSQVDLPSDTDCGVTVAASVKDKNDNASFVAPSETVTFHTERLGVIAGRAPASGEEGVDVALAQISIPFTASLKADTVTAANVYVQEMGTTTKETATVRVASAASPNVIQIVFAMGHEFKPETTYEVTVTTGVQDTYGKPLPANVVYTFETGEAE